VFAKAEGGCAKPKTKEDIEQEYEEMAEDAIETCPVGAISCDRE
jgi:ferredoxin